MSIWFATSQEDTNCAVLRQEDMHVKSPIDKGGKDCCMQTTCYWLHSMSANAAGY